MISIILTLFMVGSQFGEVMSTPQSTPSNFSPNQLNSTITDVSLSLSQEEIEYGNQITVYFGVLNNTVFVSDIPQLLYLFDRDVPVTNETLESGNYTTILNSTSSANLQSITIDTLPTNAPSLKPGEYYIYYSTNRENHTNIWDTTSFKVFPHEGAKIEISISELPSREKVTSPVNLNVNETREYLITLTNSGSGQAVDINFNVEVNEPLETDSASFPFEINSLDNLTQVSFNVNVTALDFGIGAMRFLLTYNNTLDRTLKVSPSLEFHILPEIVGFVEYNRKIETGQNVQFNVEILNNESQSFHLKFSLSSSTFSFLPIETAREQVQPGNHSYVFNGFTLINGTQRISLDMMFFDPQGNEEITVNLLNFEVTVIQPTQPEEQQMGMTLIEIILLLILATIVGLFILLYFSKPIRKRVLNKFIKDTFVPDLKFDSNRVVIDGSNVAWEDLNEEGKPQIKNISLAVEKLQNYGFEEIIVVADAALRYQIEDTKDLDQESKHGNIKVLPAKVDGDEFILRFARDTGSLILTNDLYREYREKYPWIDNRRIPYSILKGHFYLHPLYDLE